MLPFSVVVFLSTISSTEVTPTAILFVIDSSLLVVAIVQAISKQNSSPVNLSSPTKTSLFLKEIIPSWFAFATSFKTAWTNIFCWSLCVLINAIIFSLSVLSVTCGAAK